MKRLVMGCLGLVWLTATHGAGALAVRAQVPQAGTAALERRSDGIVVPVPGGFVGLRVVTDAIIRVTFGKARDFRTDTMVVVAPPAPPPVKWTVSTVRGKATITTPKVQVSVDLADGAVSFADATGAPILAETPGGHEMISATVQDEMTFHVRQSWRGNADESLYGLGQRQEGKLDLKGYDLDLWQRNMVVAVPFLVSSRGYGILWDNTSVTKFGDIRPFTPIPAEQLADVGGKSGGLSQGTFVSGNDLIQDATSTAVIVLGRGAPPPAPGAAGAGRGRGNAAAIRGWQGEILAPVTGDYQFQTYSNGDAKVWLGGQLYVDQWKQTWATEYDQFKVRLEQGKRYPIRIQTSGGATTFRLTWKTPVTSTDTALWSEVGEGIDYYFVYGPSLDQVVGGYRTLTGQAAMLPAWAFGYFQSRNKYNTQAEVLDTLAEFRSRQFPIDVIVQDWQYWPADFWGDHQFEASRYPDPDAMIRTIHDQHARFMISVWGKFYPTTANYKAMDAIGALYMPTINNDTHDWLNRSYTFYDAFSAPARKLFWDQVNTALFQRGVDAWWMDATEPDIVQPSPPTLEALQRDMDRTAIGTAARVMNAYGLMNSEAVYDGQRREAPDQRVFILTRSGFAGQPRYATVTWSGDITSTWTTLRKQIPAGLNFSLAGNPYWTTDTGGYTMEARFTNARSGDALDEWQELNARWFQFSTFSPILRAHGTDRPREPWNIGADTTPVYQALLRFARLRYAMQPYIYALAGAVTHEGYTLMRPLVMDFPADRSARDVADEFQFGPALLVSPVTTYKARTRQVYLPAGTAWYDFWTGKLETGGRTITADAPYDRLPVFARAGAIVPFGPDQQYVGEAPASTLTLYVYAGADGRFSLYEDDGRSYGYERQEFSRIPISWSNQTRTLTIGARTGTFPGMITDRTFNVIVVSPESPAGYVPGATGRSVPYGGVAVSVRF